MQQPYTNSTYEHQAVIALGANITSRYGPPEASLRTAIVHIARAIGTITGKSRLFLTPCFPAHAGPDYVNSVIMVETELTASKVLQELHLIEADFGRVRTKRWGERGLDLDLICLGSTVLPDKATFMTWRHISVDTQVAEAPELLILPHPRLQDRAFVLVPMFEVAPDWMHPVLEQTVEQMLHALPAEVIAEVVPLTEKVVAQ